jgi:ADP-glucose pyrophosphorylase
MDGCYVGRFARLRRAVVGVGALVPDGVEIGYGATPAWADERPSGLTLVGDPRQRVDPGIARESSALGA